MSDPNKPAPKTKIITEAKGQQPAQPANTDNLRTYIPGMAAPKAVGKLVIVSGDGAGGTRPFFDGTNSIGRDPDQNRVGLDVEDSYISRTGHAILNVDSARKSMSIIDGGKPNRVQVNGQPITAEVIIKATDTVQIGRTTVRFELT
jgi:pSer/pThr/pTyr-binding forkhead associated (FHA) protein